MSNPNNSIIQTISIGSVKVMLGLQGYLQTQSLSTEVNLISDSELIMGTVPLRDIVRLAFAELGIELAFSGKNDHEKGVIIDIDEERIAQLNLNRNILGFGQPVVRANATAQIYSPIQVLPFALNDLENILTELLEQSIAVNLGVLQQ